MKLVIVTAVEEFQKDVLKLLKKQILKTLVVQILMVTKTDHPY